MNLKSRREYRSLLQIANRKLVRASLRRSYSSDSRRENSELQRYLASHELLALLHGALLVTITILQLRLEMSGEAVA